MHSKRDKPTWTVNDGPWKNGIYPKCSECGIKMYSWGMVRICSCESYLCSTCLYISKCVSKND